MKHNNRTRCIWGDSCAEYGETCQCPCSYYDDGSDSRDITTYEAGLVELQLEYREMMRDYDDGNGRLDF